MSAESFPRCREGTLADMTAVAAVHLSAFPGFFLSQLGSPFLRVMYRAFLVNPTSLFFVYEAEDSTIAGFAVGSLTFGRRDRWLALRFLPQFFFAVLPALLKSPLQISMRLLRRFFEIGGSPNVPREAAFLRSIGVNESSRGSGIADALLNQFETAAFGRGAKSVHLTTDEVNNHRAQRFYERRGYGVVERFRQDGARWMWHMSKDLRPDTLQR
jgi:ribosomal protein S18 acetylase RimI-like enzyme